MEDFEILVANLADDAVTVKPAPHPYMLALNLISAATIYLILLLALSGLRPDLAQALRQPWYIAEIIALLLTFIVSSFSAALLAFPDLYQKRNLALAPLWVFAMFWVVMFFAWHADNPPAPLPDHSYQCTICITLMAMLPAMWTFYILRKFASTHYHWAGSIVLISAFSVGALWLRLHEVNDSITHLIEWHYLPMLAAGILGLWLGKIILRW